jgi:isopenicillin N synthase-like dioxygenase
MALDQSVLARGAKRVPFEKIPIIDIGAMFGDDRAAMESVAAEIDKACREIGFLYVSNHGVPEATIACAYDEAARFFALSLEDKMAIHYKQARNMVRGYVPMFQTHSDRAANADFHDAFEFSLELPADDPDCAAGNPLYGPNQWPADLPGFREGLYAYYESILNLGITLFRAFAIALDVPDDYFAPLITKPMAQTRVIHYPEQTDFDDTKQWGIGAHTDYECFTILSQDGVGGLQVRNADGEWVEAPPIPGAFTINIGDMMQRWTNDIYGSTPHRVLNRSGRERYSLALFYGANYDSVVSCLPSCQDADHPVKYDAVKSGVWTTENLLSTYFDGEATGYGPRSASGK